MTNGAGGSYRCWRCELVQFQPLGLGTELGAGTSAHTWQASPLAVLVLEKGVMVACKKLFDLTAMDYFQRSICNR